jgi:hypothetical protein
MDEVKINTSKAVTLSLDNDPTDNAVTVNVYHEFGDKILGPSSATRVSAGNYSFTIGDNAGEEPYLNSAGKYRVDFSYSVSGISYKKNVYFNVYTPYTTSSEFFALYPELQAANSSKFDVIERRARAIINTFCGQSFETYLNKKLVLNGNDHTNLHLPYPISRVSTIIYNEGEVDQATYYDESADIKNIEKVRQPFNFNSTYYIRFKKGSTGINQRIFDTAVFKEESSYSITGDWGWAYVPDNVTQAANLIIADIMNDDSEYRRHGITSVDMDNIRFSMMSKFYETTGNIEADVLLTDYMLFTMDYIV